MPEPTPVSPERPPHLFQPGQSGNPKGRPPSRFNEAFAQAIREHPRVGANGAALIEKLLAIALDAHQNLRARLEAIRLLIERGWGKSLDVSITGSLTTLDPSKLARLTDAELALAAELVAKLTAEE